MPLPSFLLRWSQPARYAYEKATFRRSPHRRHLAGLKNEWKGQGALVVGNGPSLNHTPLDRFQGVRSIGMNKIDMLFGRVAWRPDLVACVNTLVVKQHAASFAASPIPIYLSWKTRHFVPRKDRGRLHYFLEVRDRTFSTDASAWVGVGDTVTYTALQLAYHLGADPVVLVGVDHSFKAEGRPNEIRKAEGPDVNHFDPNYFKSGVHWGIPNLEESERAYLRARQAFEADGRRVLDATVGGKLTIFPKASIDEACKLLGARG